ncbi:ParB N-terminal domain-containing protein [Streptomyces sp. CA-253872]|uniref:ParB N-terminal domain-containing protein n=1 Tax=Streptomyces sp. CA-253872 TaxID=3240067 RepID=UPI003D950264
MTSPTAPPSAGAVFQRLDPIPLDELRPYPGNARRGDVAMIRDSLTANGQYRPLVVRELPGGALVVLAGNHTLRALADHGPGPCGHTTRRDGRDEPCAICHGEPWEPTAHCTVYRCDDATARRIVLADNRTADAGWYDDDALADLLADLDGDYEGTGYTDTDLTDLLDYLDSEVPDAPEVADLGDGADDQDARAPSTAVRPGPATDPSPAPHDPARSPATPPPPPQRRVVLAYSTEDHDEYARLLTAARDVFPSADPAYIALRALRALVAVIDSRHSPDGAVSIAALLKAASAGAS